MNIPRHITRTNALQIETLEHRRLLAVLTVNSEHDNLISGDGLVTLREAIIAANENSTTDLGQTGSERDRIVFDPAIDGKPILSLPGTHPRQSRGKQVALDAGTHMLQVMYVERTGLAFVALEASFDGRAPRAIPASRLRGPTELGCE